MRVLGCKLGVANEFSCGQENVPWSAPQLRFNPISDVIAGGDKPRPYFLMNFGQDVPYLMELAASCALPACKRHPALTIYSSPH
jgi:hypothetical protein